MGYILEVTLSYPEALHDIRAHKDVPLACDKLCIANEALSPLVLSMKNLFNMKTSAKTVKLAPNFNEKHRYVLHYGNLKLYLQLGLVLKKIHRVIGFYQSAWMKPYIRFNIEQRQKASNQFNSSLFKKFNNAIYGKTIENVKKRTTVKLVRKAEQFENLSSKPTFRSCKIIHRHLASIHMGKALIKLDRPIFLGFSILELAKLQMYRFHYGYMGQKYGANARLLFPILTHSSIGFARETYTAIWPLIQSASILVIIRESIRSIAQQAPNNLGCLKMNQQVVYLKAL